MHGKKKKPSKPLTKKFTKKKAKKPVKPLTKKFNK